MTPTFRGNLNDLVKILSLLILSQREFGTQNGVHFISSGLESYLFTMHLDQFAAQKSLNQLYFGWSGEGLHLSVSQKVWQGKIQVVIIDEVDASKHIMTKVLEDSWSEKRETVLYTNQCFMF